ncbi:uncharacterized protein CTRU02_201251 [Colletotrichum truncatum]|uniref:Uncharacterized protein n=1 Tax=Colletotrichum truncatum TaxID=5467 RepID=A0ACC3ZH48_COLTU|nr:uncharacterized protein CTRU02_08040 [Colletotrichum truncatum]KAF6790520.1 hypothetical protein CTRU02_08040 [Colletotrichum truncatum]
MRLLALVPIAAAASAAVVDHVEGRANGCNADNCLRAVRANRYGTATMSIRMAECSSYLAVTHTPVASTVYVTETGAEPAVESNTQTIQQRDIETPAPTKAIPAYATACPDAAAFSSACYCFGASPLTITAPTPTITSTIFHTPPATPTLLVDADLRALSCNKPWTCGDTTVPWCSAEGEKGCACFRTAEGRDVCAVPGDCKSTCDSTTDCGTGEVCVKQSCCVGGTCMKVDVCINQAFPQMMFKKRSGKPAWARESDNVDLSRLSLYPHDIRLEHSE